MCSLNAPKCTMSLSKEKVGILQLIRSLAIGAAFLIVCRTLCNTCWMSAGKVEIYSSTEVAVAGVFLVPSAMARLSASIFFRPFEAVQDEIQV